jgi:uncharacterized membrane protein
MLEQPFGIASLIFSIVSVPLIAGVIPRNRFYGVRTRDTLADDRRWRAANTFGGTAVLLSSLAYLCVALWLPYQRLAPDSLSVWTVHLSAFVAPLAVSFVVTRQYLRRLARRG